jgi:two-component system, NtrC family, sensor histidine kinase KinB
MKQAAERFEPAARDADVSVSVSAARGLARVLVDRDRIEHVFDNLLGNAIAYTPRGGHIQLSAEGNGTMATFTVRDDGRGIPPEHLPRIFEKFFRVPGSSARGGAGLGLAIAREIIVAHGGQIDVASTPGHGTTFTFRLPIDLGSKPSENGGPHNEH